MIYRNEVEIPGKVLTAPQFSHEYDGVPYYSVNLQSNCKKGSVIHDTTIRTYFSSDIIAGGGYDIKVGDFITAKGRLINSRLKGIIDISVLVDSYEVLEESDDDDVVGYSAVVLEGQVTKIFTNDDNYNGFVNFVLTEFDDEGKRLFSTRVVYWSRLADHVYNNLKLGDHVTVSGSISNAEIPNKFSEDPKNPEIITVSEVLGLYFNNSN